MAAGSGRGAVEDAGGAIRGKAVVRPGPRGDVAVGGAVMDAGEMRINPGHNRHRLHRIRGVHSCLFIPFFFATKSRCHQTSLDEKITV